MDVAREVDRRQARDHPVPSVTAAAVDREARDRDRTTRIAVANHLRHVRLKAMRLAAASDEPDPRAELLAAARGGDKHAQWRCDQFGRTWRKW